MAKAAQTCGDGKCRGSETCSTCPADCGICPTPTPTPPATPSPYPTATPTPTSLPTITPTPFPTPTPTATPTDLPGEKEITTDQTIIPAVVPEPAGPGPAGPTVNPRTEVGVGSPGTLQPELSVIGGTWSSVAIQATPGDTTAPRINLLKSPGRVIKGSQFSLSANATDDQGVIEFLAYSIDEGNSWHPVSTVSGIGQKTANFTVTSFDLADNDYGILLRARDNSENEVTSSPIMVTIDQKNPKIISLATKIGNQEITSETSGQVTVPANLQFEILASLSGGPTKVVLELDGKQFNFTPAFMRQYWSVNIQLSTQGAYEGRLVAEDGAANKLDTKIFHIAVTDPLTVKANENSKITIYEFNDILKNWQTFNASAYKLSNPIDVQSLNTKGIMLPAGKYYFKVNANLKDLQWPKQSNVINLTQTDPVFGPLNKLTGSDNLPSKKMDLTKISENLKEIKTLNNETMPTLRGKDIIILNFNPRSYASLEELSVYNQVVKNNPDRTEVIAITPSIYKNQILSLAKRGNYVTDFFFDEETNGIQENIFQYREPASLFINRKGEVKEMRAGFITEEEAITIIGRI